jgi:hypothetical protein
LAFSYWIDKPWFLTKGKLATVLIIPSSWGSQLGGYPARISRLLTHHAGGKHGDEEDLRWRFPSPVGCREELLDPPDLGSMMAADRDVFLEN